MNDAENGRMKVTTRPAEHSTVVLEVEFPPEYVRRAVEELVRHLSRRTKVPGFRPGKAPRALIERALGISRDDPTAPNPLYDDAKEHLFERSVIDAVREKELDVLSVPDPEWLEFGEAGGASYRVSLPLRPEVKLGAYADYPFGITVDAVDDEAIDKVVDELRDQQASLVPVEKRGAHDGDYAVIRFTGTRDGEPIEGAQSERMPLIVGRERFIPGFEAQLVGLREGDEKKFKLKFPDDYGEGELAGVEAEFDVTLLELRQKQQPPADDDFARSLGDYDGMAALRAEIRKRLERNALDRARHVFGDRIIDFAVANATVELPDLLIEREIEVMLDELRIRLAEQGIGFEDYLKATERDEAKLPDEYRPDAEKRVKTLLVLSEVAEKEGVQVDDSELEADLTQSRERYAANPRLVAYLESERGRSYTRSLLRRSKTVETLIDRWIGQHPEFSNVQHLHDGDGPGGGQSSASATVAEAPKAGKGSR